MVGVASNGMKLDSKKRVAKLDEVGRADGQFRAGHYIKHEDMKSWLLSWGTDHELPPPKCVCGKSHGSK